MAAGHSDYEHGSMDVNAQSGTFSGFMNGTVYGGGAIGLIVIWAILLFAVGTGWLTAIVATVVLGIVIGVVLKLKAQWYAGVIASGIIIGIGSALASLLAG